MGHRFGLCWCFLSAYFRGFLSSVFSQVDILAKWDGAQEWKGCGALRMLWVGRQWGWVCQCHHRKQTGAPGADEAASYPGQIHSVSSFGYRYLCCLGIKHPDTSLKLAWTLWRLSLYPPKEYWYSLAGSFLSWCEINTEISVKSSAVSLTSSHLTHLQRYVAFFCSYIPDLKQDAGIALL